MPETGRACVLPARDVRRWAARTVRQPSEGILAWGLAERVDDYCATAYVYCAEPQPVPRPDIAAALADIGRRPYEQPGPMEAVVAMFAPSGQD